MLRLVRNNHLLQQNPIHDDEYIEKMANFYTSEAAKTIFPNLHKTPFYEWLCLQQDDLNLEKSG